MKQNHKTLEDKANITLESIFSAAERLRNIALHTPLMENLQLSERYNAHIWLKREDLQVVRSYKIRGAYNKMIRLSRDELAKGVVCASAGNHAQGVAYACHKMGVKGTIFMPTTTPNQKIKSVKMFGKDDVEIVLVGDTYDDASAAAKVFCDDKKVTFVHPFDDLDVIEGQATVGLEIFRDADVRIDYLLLAIGGGGVAAGISTVFRQLSPHTKIIGIEPLGAASMKESVDKGEVVPLKHIDKFVDGAAVKRVGNLTFEICQKNLDDIIVVPEGKVCTTILELYNESAIVVEPAGALTIAALDFLKDEIAGKNVVCLVSGGNNDITRTEEIKERSMLYEGLKHYFTIVFPQRAGALRNFVTEILGPTDDIVLFEYAKRTNREEGPALVGLEVKKREDFDEVMKRMKAHNINFQYLNERPDLFSLLK
jgi:threonine dehydratase